MADPKKMLIAERAYDLWEGRPHGRDKDHWLQAANELAPPTKSKGTPKAPAAAKARGKKAAAKTKTPA